MSIIEEIWDVQINLSLLKENNCIEYQAKLESLHEHVRDTIEIWENGFRENKFIWNNNEAQNHDDELKSLIESNKQLRHDIDITFEELSQQRIHYEKYKNDQKLLSQEIKETHEAFLMAKKYYKKFLQMYYTIESKSEGSQTIFVQFFTEAKKESENYSVRLLRDNNTGRYQLSSVTPKLNLFKEVQKRLEETNDVPGALCCIRQAFMMTKKQINVKTQL